MFLFFKEMELGPEDKKDSNDYKDSSEDPFKCEALLLYLHRILLIKRQAAQCAGAHQGDEPGPSAHPSTLPRMGSEALLTAQPSLLMRLTVYKPLGLS